MSKLVEVKVRPQRRIYGTPDGDFSIWVLHPERLEDLRKLRTSEYDSSITVKGDFSFSDDEIGRSFTVTLQEDFSQAYPNSYQMVKIHYPTLSTAKEQWDFLRDLDIMPYSRYKKLHKELAKEKIIDLIFDNPEKVVKHGDIEASLIEQYRDKLEFTRGKALIFNEFGDIEGVGPATIDKIIDWKPDVKDTIKRIKEDPFILMEIDGIGFMLADRFRSFLGMPLDSEKRILHGIKYYLQSQLESSGNTYEELNTSVHFAANKLQVHVSTVQDKLIKAYKSKVLTKEFKVKIIGTKITTLELFEAEKLIYRQMGELVDKKVRILPKDDWADLKDNYLSNLETKVTDEQEKFLDLINEEMAVVLLGPGGVGKSWLTKIAVDLLNEAGLTVGLYAPTARAAHVMRDYVGREASTIHRGLMAYGLTDMAAPDDVIIVDEFSMVDSELASIVLRAMGNNTRLIIIGDDFQLPSVGPGNVLYDFVNNMELPVVRLTKVFRQDSNSGVLDYSQALRNQTFELETYKHEIKSNEITFINEVDGKRQKDIALDLYRKAQKKYGEKDVMLLSPVNGGDSGRRTLNKLAQAEVNPNMNGDIITFGPDTDPDNQRYFKPGDYITVRQNNYEVDSDEGEVRDLINGDLGRVIRTRKNKLTFEVDGDRFTIDKSEINDFIDHAWAITIHRSQGGQANEVIIVLPHNSYFMLNANMLYTAITRTKDKCYVIGDFNRINQSSRKLANFNRKTLIEVQSLADKVKKSK